MRKLGLLIIGAAVIAVGSQGSVQAAAITFTSSVEFSGAVAPEGPSPWLTVTFDDHDTAGTVDLTIEGTSLIGSEYVKECLFNLDPALDPTLLVFSPPVTPVKTGSFDDPAITLGINAFMADGDGYFDIRLLFSNQNGHSKKFGYASPADPGLVEVVGYTISLPGFPGLTAHSFDFLSLPDGGPGVLPTAAHVGGIGPTDEGGWITIPEPATLSLLLLGGIVALKRRR